MAKKSALLLLVLSWAIFAQQKAKTDNTAPTPAPYHCSFVTGEVVTDIDYTPTKAAIADCKRQWKEINYFRCSSRYLVSQDSPDCEGILPDVEKIRAAMQQCEEGRSDFCADILPLPGIKKPPIESTNKKASSKK